MSSNECSTEPQTASAGNSEWYRVSLLSSLLEMRVFVLLELMTRKLETNMFKPVSSKLNVTSMEENVLKFWKQAKIFKKTVEQRKGATGICFL